MHVDDLILSLQNRGYGCYIKDLFEGCIVFADDLLNLSPFVIDLQN